MRAGVLWASCAVAVLACLPLLVPPYFVTVLASALALSIACLGLAMLLTTGLLSLGHAAFFGLGAYAGGFLYTFSRTPVTLEVYLACGVLASGVVAAAFGLVCVRTSRMYFSILTLVLGELVHAVFVSGLAFRPFGGVGAGLFLEGEGGLYIPALPLFGMALPSAAFDRMLYYVVLACFTGTAAALWQIGRSPWGLALRALGLNETRALFLGIPVRLYRWYAVVGSGVLAGLAGGLFGQIARQVTPEQVHWTWSLELVLATVLGGTERLAGPIVGAWAFVALAEIAGRWQFYRMVLGGLLIAVVLLCPRGLASSVLAVLPRTHRGRERPG